jgi:hypothetical protein
MALTRDIHITIRESLQSDPAGAEAVLVEAIELFLNGEPATARLLLRDLVEAVIGIEALATAVDTSEEGLRQMLSLEGNPGMDQLAVIFSAARKHFGLGQETSETQMA